MIMIRILNFCCFAVTALTCLALYRVAEETRVARMDLASVRQQVIDQKVAMKVLQADWERVAQPGRIQQLAVAKLGVSDQPALALASLEILPRRGEQKDLEQAKLDVAPHIDPHLHDAALHTGE
jgi:hypothetical protein